MFGVIGWSTRRASFESLEVRLFVVMIAAIAITLSPLLLRRHRLKPGGQCSDAG